MQAARIANQAGGDSRRAIIARLIGGETVKIVAKTAIRTPEYHRSESQRLYDAYSVQHMRGQTQADFMRAEAVHDASRIHTELARIAVARKMRAEYEARKNWERSNWTRTDEYGAIRAADDIMEEEA